MEQFGSLFLRVLTISAGCSAVLVPLLLLAPRIRKRIAARSFYVLFLLLALRLAVPVEVSLPKPVVTVPAPEYTVSVPAAPRPAPVQVQVPAQSGGNVQTVRPAPVAAPVQEEVREIPVTAILAAVWAAGIAGCVLWAVGSYAFARRKLLRDSAPAEDGELALLEKLRGELGVKRPVRLCRSGRARSAMALGLFRPVVVLPGGSRDGEELAFILRHELTHIRRWDVAYKMALSLACAVNWFNPFVWLMSRAAGRNLELCCDDEVVRGLGPGERRRYGMVLLDAAETARPLAFSTSFASGKRQMKDRLANLFTEKKNSAALVCVVLAAALFAGGLVACEQASGSTAPPENSGPEAVDQEDGEPVSPENQARRALFQSYFEENYIADSASVVLADLTGDGLEEMLVITLDHDAAEAPSMRGGLVRFSYGKTEYFGIKDETVIQYPGISDAASSHAGWGYVYLIPNPAGEGYAILDFRPQSGQGQVCYSYGVYTLDAEEGFIALEEDDVLFHVGDTVPDTIMGEQIWNDSSLEKTEQLLAKVQAYRDSGVALLVYEESYLGIDGDRELAYLNAAPENVFGGKIGMSIVSLREHVASEGWPMGFVLPTPLPATPGEALDRLKNALDMNQYYVVFRLPQYEGTWEVQLSGRMRVDGDGDNFMSVHYLEDEEWTPGRIYSVDIEDVWFSELILWVKATNPDGTSAERSILLVKDGASMWYNGVPAAAMDALNALAQSMTLNELDDLELTIPDYEGTWEIVIIGQNLAGTKGDEDEPVYTEYRYGEGEEWKPGMLYRIPLIGYSGYWGFLQVNARVTTPDGVTAERVVQLLYEEYTPGSIAVQRWGAGLADDSAAPGNQGE